MSEYVLKTHNLSKKYKEKYAVDNVNISIKKGDIYGLIGRNGAGKTTFMKLVAGLIFMDSGSLELFESNDLNFQRNRLGVSIETPAMYLNMTARENLEAYRRLLGIPDKSVIAKILDIVGLDIDSPKKAKQFSLGMKQRLGIAISLLGSPDFLVLDEPINGLDPEGIKDIRDLLLKLNKENQITILISSHILGELSKIATVYGIINNGKLIDEFTREQLNERCKRCIKIGVDDTKKASKILETICNTKNYDVIDDNTIRLFDFIDNPGYVNTEFNKNDILVNYINVVGQDLESYFVELMGGEGND